MLALRDVPKTRLVRGIVRGIGEHSWVEVKHLGYWWVVDPSVFVAGVSSRLRYYLTRMPRVKVAYAKQQFWQDPAAEMFYERLRDVDKSYVFVDLCWHYTPDRDDTLEIAMTEENLPEFCDDGMYHLFPPDSGFLFSRQIIDDLMKRPNRKTPKLRTLRYLRKCYREMAKNFESTG